MKIEFNRVQHVSTVFPAQAAGDISYKPMLARPRYLDRPKLLSELHRQHFVNWSAATNQDAYERGVYLLVWACGIATVWIAFSQPFHG